MLKDALRHPVKRGVLGICLAAFINALAGCAEVPATNPYDPTTPVAQQAKATIKGLITLPEGDEDLSVFDAGVVLLYPPTLVLARDTVCRTTEQMRAERRAELTATDQIGAQFEFTELPHGQYVLVTCVTGYLPTIERVTAERGTATSYTISLEQVPQETLESGIEGVVRLEGQADEQHGDVRVETSGRGFAAVTTSIGAFRLRLPPGSYDLRFTKAGYTAQILPNVIVTAGVSKQVDAVLLSRDLSGGVSGRLTSSIEGFPWPLSATVELFRSDAATGANDGVARTTQPDADGQFEFSLVQPGAYFIQARAEGHIDRLVPFRISQDTTERLEDIAMVPESETVETAVAMVGQAYLNDQQARPNGSHFGILVQAFTQDNLVASTQTDEDGRFVLNAARTDYTLRFSRGGYEATSLEVRWRADCGRINCFEATAHPDVPLETLAVVSLVGRPARVSGAVGLSPFESPQRLQAVDISLFEPDAQAPLQTVNPDANGIFSIRDLAAGDYRLELRASGYRGRTRAISVRVDEHLDLGTNNLAHLSTTEDAAQFSGVVRLRGEQDHAGTQVAILFADTGQRLAVTQTNAEGAFSVSAAQDEAYRVLITRRGYQTPAPEALGRFQAQGDNYVNEAGNALSVLLDRAPLNGTITIPVDVRPDWIPLEQRFVQVTIQQQNGAFQRTVEGVTARQPAVFNDVPAGTFIVTASRTGFRTQTWSTTLTFDERVAAPDTPLVVSLASLGATQIDLEGQVLDACALRLAATGLNNFETMYRDGDFSGATLTGRFGAVSPEDCVGCEAAQSCAAFDLADANFTNTRFNAPDLAPADLSQRNGTGVILNRAHLFGAQLDGVDLAGASLANANLFGVSAIGANFAATNLTGANFTSARLSNAQFAASNGLYPETFVRGGETIVHPWAGLRIPTDLLPNNPCGEALSPSAARMSRANFAQADLTNAFLAGVRLEEATLADARISGGDLRASCLEGASLNLIDVSAATLDHADLRAARLTNAIMNSTNLRSVQMDGATLTSAIIEQSTFGVRPPLAEDDVCNTLPDWCEYTPAGCGPDNAPGLCADPDNQPAVCRCRSQLRGVNLNGANLIGAFLTDADLTDASMLGIVVGASRRKPRFKPADCRPEVVDACIDFCPVLLASLPDGDEQEADFCDEVTRTCVEVAPNEAVIGGLFTSETALCILRIMQSQGDELISDDDMIVNCIDTAASQALIDQLPERELKCTFENIQQTWSLEANGQTCEQDESADVWDCCPAYRIGRSCRTAKSSFENSRLTNAQLNGVDFADVILTGALLQSADLTATNVTGSDFTDADLSRAILADSAFNQVDWRGLSLRAANLGRARFESSLLTGTDLTNARFDDALLRATDFSMSHVDDGVGFIAIRAHFIGRATGEGRQFIRGLSWSDSFLGRSTFENLDFFSPNFESSNLAEATLRNVVIRQRDGVEARLDGIVFSQARFESVGFRGDSAQQTLLSLDNVDLRFAQFVAGDEDADYNELYLTTASNVSAVGVIFDDTRLAETTWENCDFDGATFLRSSSVWDTTFRSSDLRGVDFEGLQIVNTSFIDTDLTNSRFIGVRCQDCRFDNANLESTTFRRVGGSFTFTETTSLRFATFERDGVCGSSLRNTSLRNIDLTAADLTGICDLQSVDLENANLAGASVCRQNLHLLANTRGEVRPVECPEIPDCPGHTARCPEP